MFVHAHKSDYHVKSLKHNKTSKKSQTLLKYQQNIKNSGPSCSKLTTSLVNDSLKFTSSDTQTCWKFLLKNMSSFCTVQQNISEYYVLNPLKQLTKWPLTSSLG